MVSLRALMAALSLLAAEPALAEEPAGGSRPGRSGEADDPPAHLPNVLLATPEFLEQVRAESAATALGWGRVERRLRRTVLQRLDVPLRDRDDCDVRHRLHRAWVSQTPPHCIPDEIITEDMICAGFETRPAGTCYGDSGSFLGLRDENGRWVQVGVNSWGVGCAVPFIWDVFTNVATHREWIEKKVGHALPTPDRPRPPGDGEQ